MRLLSVIGHTLTLAAAAVSMAILDAAVSADRVSPNLAVTSLALWVTAVLVNRVAAHLEDLDFENRLIERNPRR